MTNEEAFEEVGYRWGEGLALFRSNWPEHSRYFVSNKRMVGSMSWIGGNGKTWEEAFLNSDKVENEKTNKRIGNSSSVGAIQN